MLECVAYCDVGERQQVWGLPNSRVAWSIAESSPFRNGLIPDAALSSHLQGDYRTWRPRILASFLRDNTGLEYQQLGQGGTWDKLEFAVSVLDSLVVGIFCLTAPPTIPPYS